MSTPKSKTPLTCDMRRQEVRRQLGEASGTLWQRLTRVVDPRILLIWCVFYVLVVVMLLSGRDSMPWHLMQRVDRDITARVPFSVEVALQTDDNRSKARSAVPAVYVPDEKVLAAIQAELRDWAKPVGDEPRKSPDEPSARGPAPPEAVRQEVRRIAEDKDHPGAWEGMVKSLTERLRGEYLVDTVGDGDEHEFRRSGAEPVRVPRAQVVPADQTHVTRLAEQCATAVFPESLRRPVAELIVRALSVKGEKESYTALWRYDAGATETARRRAEEQVPPVIREIKAGDMLVSANSQLSVKDLDLLKSEHAAYLREQRNDPVLLKKLLLGQAGMATLALLVMIGLAAYTAVYEGRVFYKPGRTLGLAALLLVMIGLARLIEMAEWPYDLPAEFSVALVTVAAALMTIAFSQRFSFGGAGALCILVTLASRGDFSLAITLLIASGVTIFFLKDIRTRSKVIVVGFLAAVGAALASAAAGFVHGVDFWYGVIHAACAGLAALLAGLVVQGILPQFERLFGVATSMTLLEWCDASRPLLRLLAQNAPGTYSHSLIISQMAEEAAEAIRANGLLVRVGALYHDVGKAAKPEYFVENQEARINRHDRLSPTMSLLIIVGHVKDGIEMARAYGLPKVLHQFIQEHHGTTVVRYFHQAAVDAEASGRSRRFCERDVPESEFRYPGPKPGSKESAILMLCDGCESAVRALPEPTPGRIESVVHQVVMDRLNDGQFDECDITLRELKAVERSLVKSLAAIHHGRVRYPDKAAPAGVRNGNGGEDADHAEPEAGSSAERPAEMARQA
ncbi:MAG: HDIG domain-containing protein [Phycisphaerae bacterium]|jgi:hypothetical protein